MLSHARRTSRATASSPPGSRLNAGPKSITGIDRVASSTLVTAMALKMFIVRSSLPLALQVLEHLDLPQALLRLRLGPVGAHVPAGLREYPISTLNFSDHRMPPHPSSWEIIAFALRTLRLSSRPRFVRSVIAMA